MGKRIGTPLVEEIVRARNRAVIDSAIVMAKETDADVVLLAAALPEETAYLKRAIGKRQRVISISNGERGRPPRDHDVLSLPEVRLRRRGRLKIALLEGLASGLLKEDERVVIISGNAFNGECALDTVAIIDVTPDQDHLEGQPDSSLGALSRVAEPVIFDALLGLCVELGHAGREGKPVGLLITLGDHEAVLAHSHPIVLNPFAGHPETERSILNPRARRAIREFSGVDGAFVIRGDGVIEAAGCYLQPHATPEVIPSGFGARHRAAAAITYATRCIAFVVSESSGDTRVFGGGRILMTIEGTD